MDFYAYIKKLGLLITDKPSFLIFLIYHTIIHINLISLSQYFNTFANE